MKHKRRIGDFIINFIINFLIICVAFIFIMLIVIYFKTNKNTMEIADFNGYKPIICISNSMKDEFEVGDIIIVKKAKPNEINVGDIITYRNNNEIITHRVEDIVLTEDGKNKYITKGDSNNTVDELLIDSNIVEGKYCYKIPKVGNIILMLQKPQGFIVTLLYTNGFIVIIYKIIINRKELKEFRKSKLIKRLKEKNLIDIDL